MEKNLWGELEPEEGQSLAANSRRSSNIFHEQRRKRRAKKKTRTRMNRQNPLRPTAYRHPPVWRPRLACTASSQPYPVVSRHPTSSNFAKADQRYQSRRPALVRYTLSCLKRRRLSEVSWAASADTTSRLLLVLMQTSPFWETSGVQRSVCCYGFLQQVLTSLAPPAKGKRC